MSLRAFSCIIRTLFCSAVGSIMYALPSFCPFCHPLTCSSTTFSTVCSASDICIPIMTWIIKVESISCTASLFSAKYWLNCSWISCFEESALLYDGADRCAIAWVISFKMFFEGVPSVKSGVFPKSFASGLWLPPFLMRMWNYLVRNVRSRSFCVCKVLVCARFRDRTMFSMFCPKDPFTVVTSLWTSSDLRIERMQFLICSICSEEFPSLSSLNFQLLKIYYWRWSNLIEKSSKLTISSSDDSKIWSNSC